MNLIHDSKHRQCVTCCCVYLNCRNCRNFAEAISDVLLSAFEDSGGFKDTKLDKYVPTARATFIINTNIGAQTVLRREEYLRSNADALTHKDKIVMDIEVQQPHPQPSTLNPQPSNLNPQSSTLNPQPSALIPGPNANHL